MYGRLTWPGCSVAPVSTLQVREVAQRGPGHAIKQMQVRHSGLGPPSFSHTVVLCGGVSGSQARYSKTGMMSTAWTTEPHTELIRHTDVLTALKIPN